MKILITGSAGIIGASLYQFFAQKGYDVLGVDLNTTSTVDMHCDLSDPKSTFSILSDTSPDVIIHCAAIKDLLGCQSKKIKSWNSNVGSTSAIFQYVANKRNSKIIYLSSDMVFDGTRGNYSETDIPNPINWYGVTKLFSELLIQKAKNFAICRTAMVFGKVILSPKEVEKEINRRILRNQSLFFQYVYLNLSKEKKIGLPDTIRSSPTHVELVNLGVEKIILADLIGTFHISGSEPISRYWLAKRFAMATDMNDKLVFVNEKNISRFRPKDVGLNIKETYQKLNFFEDDWDIARLLAKIKQEIFQ